MTVKEETLGFFCLKLKSVMFFRKYGLDHPEYLRVNSDRFEFERVGVSLQRLLKVLLFNT